MTDRADSIFQDARSLPPDQRDGFIEKACAGDPALRGRVDALFAAEAETIETPPGPQEARTVSRIGPDQHADPRRQGESSGGRVGRYKLLERLGEGGFGTVWAAEQSEPVKRRVALKVIKLGMDTRQVVARFEQERQALALMDHPNIAKVFDAGVTESGRPFFVMELCKGEPIVGYSDRNGLDIAGRLGLFAQVCDAVQHAHTKGIIHRDIKPSNILVSTQDGRPSVKVIDFGIAKATASKLTEMTLFTEHRQLIGTPEYMSPEQAEGSLDIDTRTDVYSLGVLLYELLTGTTPFSSEELRAAGYAEIQRIIREVEPPKPSTRLSESKGATTLAANKRHTEPRRVSSIVRGELDWIVMRAMEKDRQRRYETPSALGDDVRRYLAGEAVVAAPPSRSYRLRKAVRRNKGPVAAGVLVSAALVLGIIGTSWGLSRALREKDRADRQATLAMEAAQSEAEQRAIAVARAEEAEASRSRAETAEADALARAQELELVAEFQAEQLSAIDPELMGANLRRSLLEAAPESGRDELAASLAPINFTNYAMTTLEENIFERTIDAIDQQFATQPLVRARLLQTASDTLRELGLLDLAAEPQERALALRREHLGNDHPDTLFSINNAATLLTARGRYDEAEAYYAEALDGGRRVWGDEHPDTLNIINNRAVLLQEQGRYAAAYPLLVGVLEGRRRVLGDDHPETLSSINNVGASLRLQGRPDEAEGYLRRALEDRRRVLGAEHPDTLSSINNMGGLLMSQGRLDEAEPYYREALRVGRRVLGDDHPDVVGSRNNLAVLLRSLGRLEEAEPFFRDALESARRVLGEDHPTTLVGLNNLGSLLSSQGRQEEATTYFQEALRGIRRVLGRDHPTTLAAVGNVAAQLWSQGRLEEAETYYREQLDGFRRVLGDDHPYTMESVGNIGSLLQVQGRSAEAEPFLRESLTGRRRVLGDEHPDTITSINNVGSVLMALDRLEEAEPLLREAMAASERVLGERHPNALIFKTNYASLRHRQGMHEEAIERLLNTEPIAREIFVGGQTRRLADLLKALGRARVGLGYDPERFALAEGNLLEAHDLYVRTRGESHPDTMDCRRALFELYTAWHAGEPDAGHDADADAWRSKGEPTP